jgi:hypothetical protein
MKLRINGSAIRLRLSQTDLATFAKAGRLTETVVFPTGIRLRYGLEASPEADRLDASLDDHTLIVRCPEAWVSDWVATDRVGFEATLPLNDGTALHVLVEKDFACLHKPTALPDAFPHPDAQERDV